MYKVFDFLIIVDPFKIISYLIEKNSKNVL